MLNRVIKFRVWDEYNKELFNIEDFYFFEEQGIHDSSKCCLMQFTGLLDSTGREIYEGDIMCDQYGPFEVKWGTFGWYPFEYNGGSEVSPELYEVIGNIYENPELIKK